MNNTPPEVIGMQKRIDVINAAKSRVRAINFGDPVTNVCAGDQNPRRHSYFCEYVVKSRTNKFGVKHSEHLAKCTDRKGRFWSTDIEVIFPGHLDDEKCKELFDPIWSARYQ